MASEVPEPLSAEYDCQGWCYAPSTLKKYHYTWTIDYFSQLTSDMMTGYFRTELEDVNFYIDLLPRNTIPSSEEVYYAVHLYLQAEDPSSLELMCEVSVVNNNGEKTNSKSISALINGVNKKPYEVHEFITRRNLMDNKSELLPNDRLTIVCEVQVIKRGKQMSGKSSTITFNVPPSTLLDNMSDIFNEKKYCDVEFIVGPNGEQKFQAHKALLTARSSVFLAMFENDMEESKKNQVKVTDFLPEIFNEMLRFIYTDNVENLDHIAKDLLVIANYYNLERLKIMCEKSLCKNLNIDNAAETLVSADMFNANNLKIYTMNFINNYLAQFMKTSGYQLLKETHVKLVIEIIETFKNDSMIRLFLLLFKLKTTVQQI